MCKERKRQQKAKGKQLSMFTASGTPERSPEGGTLKAPETTVELSSRLERQRTLTENLLEKIVDYGNLNDAYEQVRRNDGSSGVDGMKTEELRPWLGKHGEELRTQLMEGTYQPKGIRKVRIPKANGGVRTLGIPTVIDRLIQQAISQVLNRYYEPHFSEYSYGFRPGRSAHQAVEQSATYVRAGKEWVVDIDLENFFDKIPHDRLMHRLRKGIGDKRVLRLINAYLKTGTMEGGLATQRVAGTPQGSPLSPLLSNILLDELDRELEKRGHSFCRYADDCNIYVKSEKAGERVMASMTEFLEKKLKLRVNREKSGVRHCSESKFLGYTLLPDG